MRFFNALRQIAAKETTGLHGLAAHPNPRPFLISTYNKILHTLQRFPEDSTYRKSVESLTSHRLSVVEKHDDIYVIEKEIGGGQVEELVQQAEAELALISKMESWKAWSSLEEKPLPGQWDK